ncbi:MAG: cellulose biosynthesis cyclic di-GMP-binding regulatory protein BcsB, partial [Candidatus Tectomicrobia bacterium]|nr:cellulose biosynthesis cyclic di-GMP-binding regulatory protein BcsB [Candidatus Tectomicrobia bacterium]
GAALRLRYTPVQVTHSTARRVETPLAGGAVAPGLFQEPEVAHDQVLVGTRAELAPYLSTAMQEQITESFVGIYPGDRDPRYVLLVISGRDEAEVTRAAMAFASLNFPFPEAPSMLVPALQLPTLPPYTAKWQVHANGRYPLHEFGVKTASFQGMYTGQVRFEVSVAPDSFVYEDSVVELKFHLAYGAGLRRDSVLNIWLNDIFMAAIPLDKAEGAVYRDYAVRLPARALQAGRNTFRFTPHMMPLLSGECIAVQDANLVLTVFDDTLLVLPNATHYARLPELALFARTGFPATIVPDGTDLAVQVAGEDSATLAAAWMLLGKLAQKVEMPLYHTTFSFQPPAQPKHRLVVGTLAHLDPQLLAAAPVRLGTVSQVPYPTLPPRLPEERSRTMVERWLRALGERFQVAAPAERRRPDLVQMLQQSALGPWTLAMMFATPSQAPQTTVLFVAAEPTSLWRGMQRGVEAAFWENLQGDVVLWGDTPASLAWQRAGTTYHLGDIGLTSRLEYYASHYPWFWSILTIVLLGLFAYLTRMLLRRFQRRHHGDLAVEEVLETPSV